MIYPISDIAVYAIFALTILVPNIYWDSPRALVGVV